MPEALKASIDVEAMTKDPKTAAWLKEAHAKGMTQGMLDFALGSMLEQVAGLAGGITQKTVDECVADLRTSWGKDGQPASEADYKANLGLAYRAGKEYGGPDFEAILKDYGNDARIVRLLANVGKDLGEDTAVNDAAGMSEPDVLAMQASPAYWNAADPQHAIVKAKVADYYAKKHGTAPKAAGAQTFSLAR